MDETEIAGGFAAGEAWAYEVAYRQYRDALFAAALAVLRVPSDAQDCVHDVLMRLWKRGSAFTTQRGSLRAFLIVCVRNDALSRLRKQSNRERIAATYAAPESAQEDPSTLIAERETVKRALDALDAKHRRTIEMAYYEGLTHQQIAAAADEPLGTIKSRLSSALRQLRARFVQEGVLHG